MEWDCVRDKLYDTGPNTQGKHFVRTDPEISLTGLTVPLEQMTDVFKNLLHDGILSEIITASLDLFSGLLAFYERIINKVLTSILYDSPAES